MQALAKSGDINAALSVYREFLDRGTCRRGGVRGRGCARGAHLGAAATPREKIGSPLQPYERRRQEERWNAARAEAGEEAFAAAWDEGHAWTWENAVAYALGAAEA